MPISTSPKSSGSSSASTSVITPHTPTSAVSDDYLRARKTIEDRDLPIAPPRWDNHYGSAGESSKHGRASENSWRGSDDGSEDSAYIPSMKQKQADRRASKIASQHSRPYASMSTLYNPHSQSDRQAHQVPLSRSTSPHTWSNATSDSASYGDPDSRCPSPHRRSRKRRLTAIPYVEIPPPNETLSRRIADGEYMQWMPGWRDGDYERSEVTSSESGSSGEGRAEEAEEEQVAALLCLDDVESLGAFQTLVELREIETPAPMSIQEDVEMDGPDRSDGVATESRCSEYEGSESGTDSSDSVVFLAEIPFLSGRSKSEDAEAEHEQERDLEGVVEAVPQPEEPASVETSNALDIRTSRQEIEHQVEPVAVNNSPLDLTGGVKSGYPWHRGKTCHQCRQPWTARPMVCSKRGGEFKCEFAYCQPCCEKYSYITFDPKSFSFICPRCSDICDCIRCYRRPRPTETNIASGESPSKLPILGAPAGPSSKLPLTGPRWSGKNVAQVTEIMATEEAIREKTVTWTRSGESRERPKPRSSRARIPTSPLSPLPPSEASSPLRPPIILKFRIPKRVPMKRTKEVDSDGDTVGEYSSEEEGRSRVALSHASREDTISPRSASSKKRPSINDYLSSLANQVVIPPERVSDSPFPDYTKSSETIPRCRETEETLAPSITPGALLDCEDELWLPARSSMPLRPAGRSTTSPVPSIPSPSQIASLPMSPTPRMREHRSPSPESSPSDCDPGELWLRSPSPSLSARASKKRSASPCPTGQSLPVRISPVRKPQFNIPKRPIRVLSITPSRSPSPIRSTPSHPDQIPLSCIQNSTILPGPPFAISHPSLGSSDHNIRPVPEVPSSLRHPEQDPPSSGPDGLSQRINAYYETHFTKHNITPVTHGQLSLGSAYPLRPISRFENLKSSYLSTQSSPTSFSSTPLPPMLLPPLRSAHPAHHSLHPSFLSTTPHSDFRRQRAFW